MSFLIAYLCKMTLISGVLYAYYHAVLRDNRFHNWNRFYLLISVGLTLLLPLIHIPVHASSGNNSPLLNRVMHWLGSEKAATVVLSHPSSYWTRFTWGDGLLWVYMAIAFAGFLLLVFRLWQIDRLRRRSPQVHLDKITLIDTRDDRTPFSIFSWVFWNGIVDVASPEGQHILRHELTHVRLRHSVDKMVIQLICIAFFPVLFFYIIRRELQLIHEYQADQNATRNNDLADYAHLLISQSFQTAPFAFANHFFHHPLKRRIAMMTQFSHPRFIYLKKLMILPIAVGLFAAMAFRVTAAHPAMIIQLQQAADHLEDNLAPSGTIYNTFATQAIPLAQDTTPTPAPLSPQTRITFDSGKKNLDSVLLVIDGKTQPYGKRSFDQLNPKYIKSVTVLRGPEADSRYGDSARNGVILIQMKQPGDTVESKTVVNMGHPNDTLKTILVMNMNHSVDTLKTIRVIGMNHPGDTLQPADDNVIFTKVEIEATFPGGEDQWNQYVSKAIQAHYNDLIKDNKSGTCTLTFIVHKDGHISNVEVTGMEGSQLDAVAMDVIKNGPHWNPAQQNGHAVSSYRRQKITFQMPDK